MEPSKLLLDKLGTRFVEEPVKNDKRSDFCAYMTRGSVARAPESGDVESPVAFHATDQHNEPAIRGRGILSSCYNNAHVCATVRASPDPSSTHMVDHRIDLDRKNVGKLKYEPSKSVTVDSPFLFAINDYCEALGAALGLGGSTDPSGLLLISGSTNSLKSQIARGLIYQIIEKRRTAFCGSSSGELRRPHLLTVEDPIEAWWATDAGGLHVDPAELQRYGLDYTPRSLGSGEGHDVRSLAIALKSALRQSPTVVYVGETRDDDDWRTVMRFAGTGHLIVTTSHAGSLTEAMGRIFRALLVKSAADRQQVASKIHGLVHLRRESAEKSELVLPSLWLRTSASECSLVANGLGAILPHRLASGISEPKQDQQNVGSLGRRELLARLARAAGEREAKIEIEGPAATEAQAVRIKRAGALGGFEESALECDLKGE